MEVVTKDCAACAAEKDGVDGSRRTVAWER